MDLACTKPVCTAICHGIGSRTCDPMVAKPRLSHKTILPVYTGLSLYFTTQCRITICPVFSLNTLNYLQVIDIDIDNTEMLFNQFVCLKAYLEKNNTNPNCEATMKLSMEENWRKFFADTKFIDQKSVSLIKLCEYAFAIPAHNANVERIFSLMVASSPNLNGRAKETGCQWR
ncbi:hypothetical protein AVEN_118568-1 [Araneus ventricosus]|uniref:HAT C-terminal dimerisation domain-containing protein n=1 Tax=Araneus ventricosus TaxID=182803 RepID=A0A4Y2AY93_ARAVE|nr:hypothetical protein AVEN_118568-1 [Araneus ventricosus]